MKQHNHWIAGGWEPPAAGQFLTTRNPETDQPLAEFARGNSEDVDRAVRVAHDAWSEYRNATVSSRESILLAAAALLSERSEQFIELLITEIGSPITKARREVATACGVLRAAAGAARNLAGKTLATDVPGRTSYSVRQPLGVVAGLTPFNVPLIKGIKHCAMPLALGNTVVLAPSAESPLCTLAIGNLFADAGLPSGCLNIVTGLGAEVGADLATHSLVKAVSFTGSHLVGRQVAEVCGRLGKRVTLEMGGKNALVVLDDADFTRAVPAAVLGSFLYQGQICMSSSRIYVHRQRYEQFRNAFVSAAESLSSGDLDDASTVIGPIINEVARQRIREHISDAIRNGASVETGGDWLANRCQPTILSGVSDACILHDHETFGPVTAIYPVDSVDDALTQVNDSRFGLCTSIFTNDLQTATRFAKECQAGMVHVNSGTIQEEPQVPFGGVGDSGFGRESTDSQIADLTEWKWITLQ